MTISVQLITRIDAELHREFKTACAARKIPMNAVVLAAVRREIAKYKKGGRNGRITA